MKGLSARLLAVQVLVKVEADNAFANIALSNALDSKPPLAERDRAFVTFLVHGVLRHRDELDAAIVKVSAQPLAKMKPMLRNLLRTAIYQLKYATDIPQSAVLNTSTEIAKTEGHAGLGKFVTGVLRAYLRQSGAPDNQTDQIAEDNVESLAQRFSVPTWLVSKWLKDHGQEETLRLLAYSQSVPDLIVRVCESGITGEALMNLFRSHGIKFKQGSLVPECLIIEDRGKYKGPLEKLPGYTDGLFVVQDESSAFASKAVGAQPGETVVDLCAAPGGKAIHIAEQMQNKGRVVAVDVHSGRLELLKRTRQRVGLTNIEAVAADGTIYDPQMLVDRVLIDAPCTGTGVINKRTDLRYRRIEPDTGALVELQRKLLANAARMLKQGGTLVYSTCSIEREENADNFRWFLDNFPNFKTTDLTPVVPPAYFETHAKEDFDGGSVQLLPTQHGVSGFFVAKLTKNE